MAHINTPLLIIAFNRPDELRKVIGALSVHTYRKIFAYVDGPRDGIALDIENTNNCRDILSAISFADEVVTNFRDTNLGCGRAVFSAISEVFLEEKELIIVEDDCVPSKGFVPYCDLLLELYRSENRVWMISGVNYSSEFKEIGESSYFFSEYAHIGAWATWKRSWDQVCYDPKSNIENLDKFKNSKFRTLEERRYFTKIFRENFSNPGYNAWGFQAFFAMAINAGLSIVPNENLVTNIGIKGTHQSTKEQFNFLPRNETFIIQNHPDKVVPSKSYDKYHFRTHWIKLTYRPILKRIHNRLRKLIFK